jgi:GNAT superfamily N-acetyltransferase
VTAGRSEIFTDLDIVSSDQRPDYAPLLAWWSYNEWYHSRNVPFDALLAAYQHRARGGPGAGFLVARVGTLPVGMVSLKLDDLWSRKDLNPWLASLYVCPEYRCRGIGSALASALVDRARASGYDRLYLFLARAGRDRLEEFYRARGWRFCDQARDNDGFETAVFYHEL